MSRLICVISLLFCCTITVSAQQPEQDCINAIPICQGVYVQNESYVGEGFIEDEINPDNSCLNSGEKNNVWYIFTVSESGDLHFTITPNDLDEDYDWAVFNITNQSCSDIYDNETLEVSCNFSETTGVTGATGATPLTSAGSNSPFNKNDLIPVEEGETYVINVSNFEEDNLDGYTINLSNSTANIFDDIPPSIEGISAAADTVEAVECSDTLVYISFSEHILCDSLGVEDVFLYGPNGFAYTTLSLEGLVCDSLGFIPGTDGVTRDRTFLMMFEPPFFASGEYTLQVISPPNAPSVLDLCGNVISTDGDDSLNLIHKFNIETFPFTGYLETPLVCEGADVELNLLETEAMSTYRWYDSSGPILGNEIGEGLNINVTNFLIEEGSAIFYITETLSTGCVSIPYEVEISNYSAPTPNFSYTIDCESNTITLNNATLFDAGLPVPPVYNWNFGDAANSQTDEQNPSFTYNTGGNYTITLEASYGLTCNKNTKSEDIYVPLPLDASAFQASLNECQYGMVSVTDTFDTYQWDWGDGIVEMGDANMTHYYDTLGTYTVQLTVSKNFPDAGCTLSNTATQIISAEQENLNIELETVGTGCAPLAVQMLSSEEADTYEWDFGDGTTATGKEVAHIYTQAGMYEVKLTVNRIYPNCTYSNDTTLSIIVDSLPKIQQVIISENEVYANEAFELSFTTNETREITNIYWEISDGTTSSESSFSHTFETVGDYQICVSIETEALGCLSEPVCENIFVLSSFWADVPSAFSPNNDGLNDVIVLEGEGIVFLDWKIYNRWGELVFETDDPSIGWDGTHNGKIQDIDVFLYTLDVEFLDGAIEHREGNISLLR